MRKFTAAAIMIAALSSGLLVGSGTPAAAAVTPAKKIAHACTVTIGHKQYTAEATLRHTGNAASAYYISRLKTAGPPISSVRFVLWQGLQGEGEPLQGWPGEPGGIAEVRDLHGNTAYFLPPRATNYATVWVTPNKSMNLDPREKIGRLSAHITVGRKTSVCWMTFRQP